jgi:hypothetical protein
MGKILAWTGRPVEPAEETPEGLPSLRRENAIVVATDYSTVPQVKAIAAALSLGFIQLGAWLIDQMLWNMRLRGIVETRLNGVIAAKVRWEPAKQNDKARRAAADIEEDWPKIAPAPARKQLHRWGLLLGVGFAQKHWYVSPTSKRAIPRLEVMHPQWAQWNWALSAYQISTLDGMALVASPSLTVPGQKLAEGIDDPRRWVVHEPYGKHSWREGLFMALWNTWLGHNWADRDMSRASEKLGLALLKAIMPQGVDEDASQKFVRAIQRLNSEPVVPCVNLGKDDRGDERKYDLVPIEFGGVGFDMIERTKGSKATDMAVGILGHNTTAETKGATGMQGGAQVGDLIRGDVRSFDADAEKNTIERQVVEDWAEANYGDREVAPRMVAETDPPAINVAGAQVLNTVAQAIQVLRQWAPGVDFDQLLGRFRVPLQPGGAGEPIPGAQHTPPAQQLPPGQGEKDANE